MTTRAPHHLIPLALLMSGCIAAGDASIDPGEPSPTVEPPDELPASVILEGRLLDADVHPIEGADVCVLERPELGCAVSDDVGRFMVAVPTGEAVHVSVESPLFMRRLFRVRLEEPATRTWTLDSNSWLAGQMMRWGIDLDPDAGVVMLDAQGEGAHVALGLSPAPPSMACAYLASFGHLELDVGTSEEGVQYCFDVPPGIYTGAIFTPPKVRCVDLGWPAEPAVVVEAGAITVVEQLCTEDIGVVPR